MTDRKSVRRPKADRERVVREIVGRAISHDLRSPMMHFQDDLADAVERQEKTHNFDAAGQLRIKARLEGFNDLLDDGYNEFRKVAAEVRAIYTPFHWVYPMLQRRVRTVVERLIAEMQALISEADRQKLLSHDPKLKRDLNRFWINVDRLYNALETISDLGSEIDPEPVNLPASLRRLYVAAAGRDASFNFGHVPPAYLTAMNWRPASTSTVIAMPQQIISALQNVLLNALRYAAESERHEVFYGAETGPFAILMQRYADRIQSYNPAGDWILFHILNSGSRIAEAHQERVFGYGATFGSNAHERYGGGSGVGLAIAKLMVTDNGGLIFYNPSNQCHTDFCIALPLHPDDGISEAELFSLEYSR